MQQTRTLGTQKKKKKKTPYPFVIGKGNSFRGFLSRASQPTPSELKRISETAARARLIKTTA